MSKWTKHADWQPKPKMFTKIMPICPACKQRVKWNIYDVHGWTERGYKAECKECGAQWESTVIEKKDAAKTVLLGPILSGGLNKIIQFPTENSIMVLKNIGNKPKGNIADFIDKDMPLLGWKQMTGSFCANCGTLVQENEQFCPECGNKKQD